MKKKNLSSQIGYDLLADDYKVFHSFLDSFDWPQLKNIIKEYVNPSMRVLDAGCGDGRIAKRLSTENIIFTDISYKMLWNLKKRYNNSLCVQSDVLALPFKESSFDIVIALFLLVHIQNMEIFFNSVSSVIKSDGLLICNSIPQRSSPVFKKGKERFVIQSYDHSFRMTLKAAEKVGFTLLRSQEIFQKDCLVSTICVFQWKG